MKFSETTALRKIAILNNKIRIVQGGTCFCAGTSVLMAGGSYKDIEQIVKGDTVLSLAHNLDIIESEVYDNWDNEPVKPIISFSINNEIIKATYDHKFYTPNGYKELYKIIWGALDTSQRLQLKLLCEQYGSTFDDDASWWENSCNNEASDNRDQGQEQRIQDNENSNERKNGLCPQGSSSVLGSKSTESQADRPPKRNQYGQQSSEPGVGDSFGKHAASIQTRTEATNGGRDESQSDIDRQAGHRDTAGVGHDTQSFTERVSSNLWGLGSEHKGHSGISNLSTFTPEHIQIQEPEKTFAISVRNVNYFVGENKINVSNSAGKTIAILLYLIALAQTDKEKTLTSVVSESFPHLKRGALRDFKNILQAHGYWKDDSWNATDSIYTFETGSQIEFFSTDNGDKLRGGRRDRCFMNEANNCTLDAFDQLEVRTKEFIILDYNPTNEFWALTDIKPTRTDVDFIILTYEDNEALSTEIIASIEARKERVQWWRVYGQGLLGEVEGRVYTGWQEIEAIPFEARLERFGLDFGYSTDPTAIVAVYSHNGGLILDEVTYLKGLSNKRIADILLGQDRLALVVADCAEPKSIDEIASYGISIVPCIKGPDSVRSGIQVVQEQRISYTKRSHNIRKEYNNLLWRKDRDGHTLSPNVPEPGFDHAGDALRYAITDMLKNPTLDDGDEWAGSSLKDL